MLLAVVASGCNKESIFPWDDYFSDNGNGTQAASTSGVTGSSTLSLSQDEEIGRAHV